jgi:2-oxo-3-hexenedioate decarboxylase
VISSNLLCARADCWIIIAVDPVEIYQRLSTARRLAQQVEPPSRSYSGFSLAAGYAVARLLDEEMLAAGAMRVGKKLGFTNQDVWSHVGLDTPFWSPMYDTTVTETPSVSLAGLVQPRIEPEIILGSSADLPAGASAAEIGAAIGWAAAGFEIVQCHYPRWEMTPADAVADAGVHAILVVGERVDIDPAGAAALADVDVELLRGETVVSRGRGSNALGGPVQAIAWLLRIPGVDGLVAGDIVTTGTLTPAHPLTPGECWRLAATGGPGLRGLTLHVDAGEN